MPGPIAFALQCSPDRLFVVARDATGYIGPHDHQGAPHRARRPRQVALAFLRPPDRRRAGRSL